LPQKRVAAASALQCAPSVNAILLTLALASTPDSGVHVRGFLGGSVGASVGETGIGTISLNGGGPGLAGDLGLQLSPRWSVYLAVRGSTLFLANDVKAFALVELALTEHLSLATGAGALGMYWLGLDTTNEWMVAPAVPLRLSLDVGSHFRLSLEGGAAYGTVSSVARTTPRDPTGPTVWVSLLVGAFWG
jgi:hypothetical protein